MKEVEQVIETIKNANTMPNSLVNVETFYPPFIMELENISDNDLKKSTLLYYLYVATGEFVKARGIYNSQGETTLEDRLLILKIASIIPIKPDLILQYNALTVDIDDKKFLPLLDYPSQDIAPSLSSQPALSPSPENVNINDIDAFVRVVNSYISGVRNKTFEVSIETFRNNMNSILSAIATSSDREVENHASIEMKKIIGNVKRSSLDYFIITNPTFSKVISEINDTSLLYHFLITRHFYKIDAAQMLTAASK